MKNGTLDLLLQADETKLVKPTKEVEIKRLSEAVGSKVIFTCEALSTDRFAYIQESTVNIQNGQVEDINTNEVQIFTILEGVKEPSLKSRELQEKFNAPTPKELVMRLLLPGEITELYNIISGLSGFGDDAVREIKNS